MAKEITGPERSAIARLSAAISGRDDAEIVVAERAVIETARATGAAEVWEAWAFLSAETNSAVDAAVARERELIMRRLEALYADPEATWDQILSVARDQVDDGRSSAA